MMFQEHPTEILSMPDDSDLDSPKHVNNPLDHPRTRKHVRCGQRAGCVSGHFRDNFKISKNIATGSRMKHIIVIVILK